MSVLVLAVRRLIARRGLALAASLGLTVAVALAMSVPLYADAVYQRLLLERLEDEAGLAGRPPFAFKFAYVGAWHGPVQWEAAQPLTRYLAEQASADLGLPRLTGMHYVRTDNFQLFPAHTTNYADARAALAWMSFATLGDLAPHIHLLEGALPAEATTPEAAAEVLMSGATALRLGVQVGEQYVAFRRYAGPLGDETVQIPVRIAGVWAANDPDEPYWCCRQATFEDQLIVPEATFAGRISPYLSDEVYAAQWYFVLDGTHVHTDDVAPLLARLAAVRQRVSALLPNAELDLSPEAKLRVYAQSAARLSAQLFAYSPPVMALILVFIGLVMGLAVEAQRNELAVLRSRGATLAQVVALTALEGLLLAAVSVLLGTVLSLWLACLAGQARGFLDFTGPASLRVALTPAAGRAGLAAAGLALLAYVLPVFGAARRSIVAYKQERARALRPPWWQRAWLDLLLLLVAAYGFYVLRQQGGLAAAGVAEAASPWQNPLLFLLPALTLLALSLAGLRLLPWLTDLLAWLAAPTRSVALLLAARQLARMPALYNAPVLLLVLTLSLATLTGSTAETLDQHLVDATYYRLGADVRFVEGGPLPAGLPGQTAPEAWFFLPVSEHRQWPGVRGATRVGRFEAEGDFGGRAFSGVFLGVDRFDFTQVAFWRREFAPAPLGALMNALALAPDGVLLPAELIAAFSLRPGDPIRLTVNTAGQPTVLELRLAGSFHQFPTWYPADGHLFVGNLDYVFEQVGAELPYEVWLRTDPGANEARLRDGATSRGGRVLNWESARRLIAAAQQQPERQGLLGLLSISFVATAALTAAGFLLYALFSFRRRYIELGVLRALGLSMGQMAALLACELAGLILVGLAAGTLLGVWLSRLSIPYFQPGAGDRFPPYAVRLAWSAVFDFYVLFVLLCVGALAVLVVQLRRMRVFEALKLGETA